MKITIGFSRPKKWFVPFAWAIMAYQKTNYSHAYVKFSSASIERTLIYQASGQLVNFIGSEQFDNAEVIVAEYEIEITDDKRKALMQFFVDKAGTPYGVLQCIGLVLNRQFGWNLLRNGDKEFVCSELVARVLHGLDVPDSFPNLDYVTPKDVRALCDTCPLFTRTV